MKELKHNMTIQEIVLFISHHWDYFNIEYAIHLAKDMQDPNSINYKYNFRCHSVPNVMWKKVEYYLEIIKLTNAY